MKSCDSINSNKCIHDLQSDVKQLKLSLTSIESTFDVKTADLNDKLVELSSALESAHGDYDQLRH